MAEVAAGAGIALAAEEVVSTGVQAGVAGYIIAKPTMPLKVTYTMIANAQDDTARRSLARSNHTLTIIGNHAYIFGGQTASKELASNDMHVVTVQDSGQPDMDYRLIPAITNVEGKSGKVPKSRTKHAACSLNGSVAVYGGVDEQGEAISETSCIWLFDTKESTWRAIIAENTDSAPGPRSGSKLFAHGDSLILFGGEDDTGKKADVWQFDTIAETWTKLCDAPVATQNVALANGQLYLISGEDEMSSQLHHLDLSTLKNKDKKENGDIGELRWEIFAFPTNPIAPGPRPRHGAGILPITTGYGRNYLIYFMGARDHTADPHFPEHSNPEEKAKDTHEVTQWSDMWTLQLPSSDLQPQSKLSISEAIKPAKIKDAIRNAFGADSGQHAWAEVEVQVPEMLEGQGKLHPGPRANFGCDVMGDGKSAVIWGGEDAKGERIGDGWIVRLE